MSPPLQRCRVNKNGPEKPAFRSFSKNHATPSDLTTTTSLFNHTHLPPVFSTYILSPYTHPVRYTTSFLFAHSYSLLLQHHRQHDFLIHLLRGRQSPPHNLPTLLGITGPGLQDQRDRQGSRAPRPQQLQLPIHPRRRPARRRAQETLG